MPPFLPPLTTQAITTLKRKGRPGCLECANPKCNGNALEYDETTGKLHLFLSHHKNERRTATSPPLYADLHHPALVRVLALYDTVSREALHGLKGEDSDYRFLSREGPEVTSKGQALWHRPFNLGGTYSVSRMVMGVTARVLGITPGLA